MKTTKSVNSEASEQIALFKWANRLSDRIPELKWLFHIPNGGSRNKIEASRLKLQGVKPGVPDIFLPVPRNGFLGLFIELKRSDRKNHASEKQIEFMEFSRENGYYTVVCYGAAEAKEIIRKYLSITPAEESFV